MGCLDRFDLNKYISKYDLKYFIETGTGDGTSLDYALKSPFIKYYSVELYEPIFNLAKKKYEGKEHLTLVNDNSEDGLDSILKNDLDSPILFWLDAHFPGADYKYTDYNIEKNSRIRIPLQAELEVIKKYRTNKDVIIIDDLRIYEDGPFQDGNWKDRFHLGGNGINFIFNLFSDIYNIEKDFRDQGYVILTPKGN